MPSLRTAAGALAGCLLVPTVAFAQVPQVTAVPGSFPNRIVNGTALTTAEQRQTPFDPNGVSYSDCAEAMTLAFQLTASGFVTGQQLQVWGSLQSTDCTQVASRTSSPPTCWPLSPPFDAPADGTSTYQVQVQDLVGYQKTTPTTTYAALGATACVAQTGQDQVPMFIWFMPIDTTSNEIVSMATLYQYSIATDLVGPAPPTPQPWTVGDGTMTANWSPNTDTDTIGYDVYVDPPPSSTDDGGPYIECDDAGAEPECYTVTPAGGLSADAGVCPSVLTSFQNVVTTASGEPTEVDEAGAEASTVATTEGGAPSSAIAGIGGIPAKYLVTAPDTNLSVIGLTKGSYAVNGLQDYKYYKFVVAAADSEGNVGPAAGPPCDFPDKTTDFFQTYKADGGAAGGCALESGSAAGGGAAAAGVGLLVAASAWRRRKNRRPSGK